VDSWSLEGGKKVRKRLKRVSECRTLSLARRLRKDSRGVAAIEFAFIASFLAVSFLNAADVALFLFDRLQVENAAEMGVQAVWASCDLNHTPATTKCSNVSSTVSTAVHSTALGSHVSVASGYPTEGYYCVNSSGALQYMADTSNKPADCSGAGMAGNGPGDYIQVQVTYTYAPMFSFTVASVLPTTISETATLRLG
jgi:Flp pilus assembly protein TadG